MILYFGCERLRIATRNYSCCEQSRNVEEGERMRVARQRRSCISVVKGQKMRHCFNRFWIDRRRTSKEYLKQIQIKNKEALRTHTGPTYGGISNREKTETRICTVYILYILRTYTSHILRYMHSWREVKMFGFALFKELKKH